MFGTAGHAVTRVPPQTHSVAVHGEVLRKNETLGIIKIVVLASQMERSSPVLFLPECF